jgi:GlpG protein
MLQQPNWYILAKRYPGVTLLVVLSAVGGMLVSFSSRTAIGYFSFGGMNDGQYWRWLTPIFLHFGILHFIFNSLWLSMLGSRIEEVMGTLHVILIVVTTGVVSNAVQFWWSEASNFGGMSGVVYALLGYLWIANSIAPHPFMLLPKGIVPFMIGWLVLCMTPLVTFLLGVGIANAAHLGGLLSGMSLGLAFGLLAKLKNRIE